LRWLKSIKKLFILILGLEMKKISMTMIMRCDLNRLLAFMDILRRSIKDNNTVFTNILGVNLKENKRKP
jgi:hypothetical protein